MGRIIGKVYNADTEVAGVRLGQPNVVKADGSAPVEGDSLTDCYFQWDDSKIPDGEIDAAGVLTVTAEDEAPIIAVKVGGVELADAVKVAGVKGIIRK